MQTNGQKLYALHPTAGLSWEALPASVKFDFEQAAAAFVEAVAQTRFKDLEAELATAVRLVETCQRNLAAGAQNEALLKLDILALTTKRDQLQGQVDLLTAVK